MAKAGKPKFRLNKKQFAEVAELVRPAVEASGRAVAAKAEARLPPDIPVKVQTGTARTGRPQAIVGIYHISGLPRQAKNGVLTKAAAECGLEVTRYKER